MADNPRSGLGKGDVELIGIYIDARLPTSGPAGLHLVPLAEMPSVDDGGCAVVTVFYNVGTKQLSQAVCNGEA